MAQLLVTFVLLALVLVAIAVLWRALRTGKMLFVVVDADRQEQPILFGCFVAIAIVLLLYATFMLVGSAGINFGFVR